MTIVKSMLVWRDASTPSYIRYENLPSYYILNVCDYDDL